MSEEVKDEKTEEIQTPNAIDEIKSYYENQISDLKKQNEKLSEQVDNYSRFLKSATFQPKSEEKKEKSDDLISKLIRR